MSKEEIIKAERKLESLQTELKQLPAYEHVGNVNGSKTMRDNSSEIEELKEEIEKQKKIIHNLKKGVQSGAPNGGGKSRKNKKSKKATRKVRKSRRR